MLGGYKHTQCRYWDGRESERDREKDFLLLSFSVLFSGLYSIAQCIVKHPPRSSVVTCICNIIILFLRLSLQLLLLALHSLLYKRFLSVSFQTLPPSRPSPATALIVSIPFLQSLRLSFRLSFSLDSETGL